MANKIELRKQNSERLLREVGIIVPDTLPSLMTRVNARFRTSEQIAARIVGLAYTNLVAFNSVTPDWVMEEINKHDISDCFTPGELEFLRHPTDEAKMAETWRAESIWLLLWSLKIVDDLPFPDHMIDLNKVPLNEYPVTDLTTPDEFIDTHLERRTEDELLDVNDFYYRCNWACVDAGLNHRLLTRLNPEVVYERHYASNWLVGYENQNWDDITTDT